MTDPNAIHPDLFPPERAAAFLGLQEVCPTPEAAIAALQRLAKRAKVKPLVWGKQHTFHRTHLEAIIAHELGATASAPTTEPKDPTCKS